LLKQEWAINNFKQDIIEFENFVSITTDTGRMYKTPKGMIYPSVTTALSMMSKQAIIEWRKRIGEEEANKITRQATRRGTNLHNLLEKYLMNDYNYGKGQMPSDLDLFYKIKTVLDKNVTLIRGQEFPLYSDVMKIAGRCDLLCDYDGELSVVDFKSAAKEKKEEYILNYYYQATAYCLMIKELKNIDVKQFYIIIASEQPAAQVFRGEVSRYRDECIEYFTNYYNIQNYNQETLKQLYG